MRILLFLLTLASFLVLLGCNPKSAPDLSSKKLCADGIAEQCTLLAFELSYGPDQNLELAKTYHNKSYELNLTGCNEGDMKACDRLGYNYQGGYGTEKSIQKSIEVFNQACNASVAKSCEKLGQHFSEKAYRHLRKSRAYYAKARLYFSRECESFKPSSCISHSRLLERGLGGRIDKAGAFKAAQRSCDIGEPKNCGGLADKYLRGIGTPQDKLKAAEISHEACLDGSGWGCAQLGYNSQESRGILKNHPNEQQFYEQRCDAKHGGACFMLGRLYLFGYGVERDEDKFNSLKLKSCELGYEKGCELSDEIDTPKE